MAVHAIPLTEAQVWSILGEIVDPEIPVVTLVELGVITGIEVRQGSVRVGLRPTFAGCPALEVMRREIRERLGAAGATNVAVDLVLHPPWSTDDIRPEARRKLETFGLAPPPGPVVRLEEILVTPRACPRCGSHETEVRNEFGPTPCRTIHFCRTCRQPFEGMKPL